MSADWPRVPLGDVLRLTLQSEEVRPDCVYPTFGVYGFGRGLFDKPPVSGSEISATKLFRASAGQFVYSRLKAFEGAFGLVPPQLDGRFVTNEFPTFDCVPGRLDQTYLNWYFRRPATWGEAARLSAGVGARRERLHPEEFLSLSIPLPPLAEQRRIVTRVEAVAARIAEAQQLREEAGGEADALLASARRHAFAAVNHAPTSSLEEVCESIIDTLHSDPIYSEVGVPCVRSPDVREGWLDLQMTLRTSEEEFLRRTVRTVPRPDDLLFVRQGGGTGRVAVVQEDQRFSLGQAMMLLRPNPERIEPRFLYHQLRSPQVLEAQLAPCYIGTASPRVNIGELRRFRLVVPPLPEQRRIVAHLDALQAKADTLRALQSETAAELDALLPAVLAKAFAGEL